MRRINLFLFLILTVFCLSFAFAANPSGATVTPGTSSSAPADSAGSDTNALAGNVTELAVSGYSNTQTWQGYFGNVSGVIQLANSDDNVMYNWSLTAPDGEVYAANSSSVTWASIDCYDLATNGDTLEGFYNIGASDVDGVNETFSSNDHAEFFTAGVQHTAGECNNTKLFNDGGVGTFTEVLLADGGVRPVFAALLNDNTVGFDGDLWDFEMLVLEDGHGADTSASQYWFWVELE